MSSLEKNGLQVRANLNKLFPNGFPKYNAPSNNNWYFSHPNPASHTVRGVKLPGNVVVAQSRGATKPNRVYRNSTIDSLPNGRFLYMIEVSTTKPYKYYKQFIKVEDKLELGSKHFQIASKLPGRTILAAGELFKKDGEIQWNLGSGTYMARFLREHGGNAERFKLVVSNAFRNSTIPRKMYTNGKLLNVPPTKLRTLLKHINEGTSKLYRNKNSNYESDSDMENVLREKHKERIAAGQTTVNTAGKKLNEDPPSVSKPAKRPRTNS